MKSKLASKITKEYGAPKVLPSISKSKISSSNYRKKLVSIQREKQFRIQNKGVNPEDLFVRLLLLNSKTCKKEKPKESNLSPKTTLRPGTPVSDGESEDLPTTEHASDWIDLQIEPCSDDLLEKQKVKRCITPVSDEKLAIGSEDSKLTNCVGLKFNAIAHQSNNFVVVDSVGNATAKNHVSNVTIMNREVQNGDDCIEAVKQAADKTKSNLISPSSIIIKTQNSTKRKISLPTTNCIAPKKLCQEKINCIQSELLHSNSVTKIVENCSDAQMDIDVDVEMVNDFNPFLQPSYLLQNKSAKLLTNEFIPEKMDMDVDSIDVEMVNDFNPFLQPSYLLQNKSAKLLTNEFIPEKMDMDVDSIDVEMVNDFNPFLQPSYLLQNKSAKLLTNEFIAEKMDMDFDGIDVEMVNDFNPFLQPSYLLQNKSAKLLTNEFIAEKMDIDVDNMNEEDDDDLDDYVDDDDDDENDNDDYDDDDVDDDDIDDYVDDDGDNNDDDFDDDYDV